MVSHLKKKEKLFIWKPEKNSESSRLLSKKTQKRFVLHIYMYNKVICTLTCPKVKNKWNPYTEVFSNELMIDWVDNFQFIISYNLNYEMCRFPTLPNAVL